MKHADLHAGHLLIIDKQMSSDHCIHSAGNSSETSENWTQSVDCVYQPKDFWIQAWKKKW